MKKKILQILLNNNFVLKVCELGILVSCSHCKKLHRIFMNKYKKSWALEFLRDQAMKYISFWNYDPLPYIELLARNLFVWAADSYWFAVSRKKLSDLNAQHYELSAAAKKDWQRSKLWKGDSDLFILPYKHEQLRTQCQFFSS